jgi:hypothetical protein
MRGSWESEVGSRLRFYIQLICIIAGSPEIIALLGL